jgi:hypothetical protein
MLGKNRRQTVFKISAGATSTLVEGWYHNEAEFSACEAHLHAQKWLAEAGVGEAFELGFADIVKREDGFYITESRF